MNRYQELLDEIRTCRVLSEIVEEQDVTPEQRLAEMRDRLARAERLALELKNSGRAADDERT
ncbi:hypothetical protein [Marinobacter sp. SS8-8]|uniref:hypothetical protein n=1 Tax=Marinobacter sp. SS8-8 TaxID=3050452 RepID=UPI0026E0EE9F|nr:hypothetical protein [Marinobacter sp. SS8-8]